MSAPRETFTLSGGAEGRIWLNGRENPILQLRSGEAEGWGDAVTWGFPTVEDWRTFAKACLRFDEALGVQS